MVNIIYFIKLEEVQHLVVNNDELKSGEGMNWTVRENRTELLNREPFP